MFFAVIGIIVFIMLIGGGMMSMGMDLISALISAAVVIGLIVILMFALGSCSA